MAGDNTPDVNQTNARPGPDRALAELWGRSDAKPKVLDEVAHTGLHDSGSPDSFDLTNPNLHYGSNTEIEARFPVLQEVEDSPRTSVEEPLLELPLHGVTPESANSTINHPNLVAAPEQNASQDPAVAPALSSKFPVFSGHDLPTEHTGTDPHPGVRTPVQTGNNTPGVFDHHSSAPSAVAAPLADIAHGNTGGGSVNPLTVADPDPGPGPSPSPSPDPGPSGTTIANQNANEGQTFSLDVSSHFAAPASGDALTYSATLPAGLGINAATGVISGIPTDADFGNNSVTVTATDAHGKTVSESFSLAVTDAGPTATAIANQSANEGQTFSLDVSSHFTAPAAGDALTYSATLPAGLSINATTGVISGIPTDADFGNNSVAVTATDAHGQAVTEHFTLTVADAGPTATTIANQSANEGQTFSLDVSSHFTAPAAGDALTYSASLPAGLGINATTGVISGVPTDADFGNNNVTVTATDAHGQAVTEHFTLTVADAGPTATTIADQSANEGQTFSLDVSSHFTAPAAGDTLTYSASLPTGLAINATTGVISGIPTDADFGNNSVAVTATDAHGQAVTEHFALTVSDPGPTGTAIADQSANEGQTFSLDVSSHFTAPAAGDTLTYSASLPTGLAINASTGVISGAPTGADLGDNPITITATDAHGVAVSQSFTLTVTDPGPTTGPIANQTAPEGQPFSLDVSSHFTAQAGDTLTFSASLPAGIAIDPNTGVISGVPTDADFGANPVTVTATDAHGVAVSQSFTLTVIDPGPTDGAIANQTAPEGQPFSLDVSSHFTAPAAGDTLSYSASLPAGLSINATTGVISGVPTDADLGNNNVTVTATDAHGAAVSESFTLTVTDPGPTATAIANQTANEGQAFSLDVSSHFAPPAAGDTLTYSASLPTGLSINATTGVISGTPTDGDFGNNTVTVTATDAHGQAVSESFALTVTDPGPTGTAIANQTANEGQAFSLDVSSHFAAPVAGDSLTYSASLPTGLAINSTTGVISGTPTDSDFGNNTVTVTATDAHGKTVSESFTLAVGDPGPTGTAIANQSANEGQAFSLDVSSHFTAPAAGDALTYSATLPTGLAINATTGVISGTPTDSDFGNNTVTVTATDAHGKTVSESFTLAVGDPGPTGTAIANQSANEGQAFSLDVSSHFTAPAAGDALTYSASLPTGLAINSTTGVISGTPTDAGFGSNSVTVTATDAHGQAVSEHFTLTVTDPGPTGTAIANQSANEGQAFSLDVSSHFTAPAAGDALTYSATLPAGLSINATTGVISGTPTDAGFGSNSVTVTATDAHGQAVSEHFTLAVTDPGPTGTAIANQTANQGQAFSFDVSSHFTAPAAGDTLTYSATLPAGLSINATTGVISGTPTSGDVGSNPISVVATDAHGMTVSESFTLTVNAPTMDASNVVPGAQSGTQFHTLAISGVSIADSNGSANVTTTLSVGHGVLTIPTNVSGGLSAAAITGNGTGTVTLTGTVSAIDATLAATNGLVYNPGTSTGGFAGTDTLTMTTTEQGFSQTAVSTVPISIVSANNFSLTTSNDDVYFASGTNTVSGQIGQSGSSSFTAGDTLVGGSGLDTLVLSQGSGGGPMAITDALFDHVSNFDTLSLQNAATVTFGANEATSGIHNLIISKDAGSVTDTNAVALNIDASATDHGSILTLSGSVAETVTGISGTLSAGSMTGALTVQTGAGDGDPIAITTGSGVTSITDSHGGTTVDVDATALGNNTTLTLAGSGNEVVTGLTGDISASSLTGQLTVTTGNNTVDDTISITTGSGVTSIAASGANDVITVHADAMSAGNTLTLSGSDAMTVSLGAGTLSASGATGNLTVASGTSIKSITLGSGNDTITTGIGDQTITGGNGSDTFITHVGDGNETFHGGTGASWVDTISLHSGSMSLGTYGTDWTLSISSGSIVSTDNVNHIITLSQDASGTIHMPDGHNIAFTEIEKIAF